MRSGFVLATLNGPSGKRLAPFMADVVCALERFSELRLDEGVRAKICSMSSASTRLAPERRRQRSGTVGGNQARLDAQEEIPQAK
jgi:hypothetical protein